MYSENDLNQMKKDKIVKLFLQKQEEHGNLDKIVEQLSIINKRLEQVESQLVIATNTSSLLQKKTQALERQLLASQQYSRRECLDFSGIDKDVTDSDLEEKVVEILSNIDINIDADNDIQACHRIGRQGNVIVKFSNRKIVGKILSKKRNLDNDIFINESLCPLNRKLRGCCSKLLKSNKIFKLTTRNGMIKIKLTPNFITVDHKDILTENFPDFVFRDFDKLQ